jgi:hypothetical protein
MSDDYTETPDATISRFALEIEVLKARIEGLMGEIDFLRECKVDQRLQMNELQDLVANRDAEIHSHVSYIDDLLGQLRQAKD